jgi:threonine dehydratase
LRTQALGEINFAHLSRYLDGVVTVSEAEIRRATRQIAVEAKLVAEPSGAVTFAAYAWHAHELPAGKTVAVITGGNIEPELLAELLRGEPTQAQSSATHP